VFCFGGIVNGTVGVVAEGVRKFGAAWVQMDVASVRTESFGTDRTLWSTLIHQRAPKLLFVVAASVLDRHADDGDAFVGR